MEALVFLSYAAEDVAHREALEKHLEPLRHAGALRLWHEGLSEPGTDGAALVREHLDQAAVVLLLVSADYLASEACRDEMQIALARARSRSARVVPILLRPCLAGLDRIRDLAPLPSNRQPVTVWPDRDAAWTEVANGVAAFVGAAGGEFAPQPAPHDARGKEDRLHALAQLEDVRVRKKRLAAAGASTAEVDAEILALERKLREGGQVRPGDILGGRYTLLRRIGDGGFATVWEAEDREQRQRVAVKVLHPNLASDPGRRERFFRGARVMADLSHEAIVRILASHEEDGGFCYFVMELLSGGDLQTAVLEGRIAAEAIVPVISSVGDALATAHDRGFVHRDVKPANILLGADFAPKLSDFDLVGGKETTGGTRTGAMGSFVYAAPELLERPQDADGRADQFGLGMTALFCLHGKKLPTTTFGRPDRVLDGLGRPALAKVIAKAIAWEPGERFEDVRSFCEALRAAEAAERAEQEASMRAAEDVKRAAEEARRKPPAHEARIVILGRAEPARVEPESSPPSSRLLPPPSSGSPKASRLPALTLGSAMAGGALLVAVTLLATRPWRSSDAPSGASTAPSATGAASAPSSTEAASASVASLFPHFSLSASSTPGYGDIAPKVSSTPGLPASAPSPAARGTCPGSMVAIVPSGPVWIGSTDGVGESDEHPRHQVTLKPYCIDRTEVTVAAYARCVAAKKCAVAGTPTQSCNGNKPDRQDHPVNCVTWEEAKVYCAQTGGRLPSEKEWEIAARGPEERRYPWGPDSPYGQLCWNGSGRYRGEDTQHSTCPVGSYRGTGDTPNGLSDMAGNVWEWTSSSNCQYPSEDCTEPRRVVRGGSWFNVDDESMRAANRRGVAPAERDSVIGFRCAKDM